MNRFSTLLMAAAVVTAIAALGCQRLPPAARRGCAELKQRCDAQRIAEFERSQGHDLCQYRYEQMRAEVQETRTRFRARQPMLPLHPEYQPIVPLPDDKDMDYMISQGLSSFDPQPELARALGCKPKGSQRR